MFFISDEKHCLRYKNHKNKHIICVLNVIFQQILEIVCFRIIDYSPNKHFLGKHIGKMSNSFL